MPGREHLSANIPAADLTPSRSFRNVLNPTPKWRVEWGGLLAFHDDDGPEVRALAPAFNRLNLLRVPRRHSVTEVTRAAAYRRYALTGWLRS